MFPDRLLSNRKLLALFSLLIASILLAWGWSLQSPPSQPIAAIEGVASRVSTPITVSQVNGSSPAQASSDEIVRGRNMSYFSVLLEIASRLSEEQIDEAENELAALLQLLDGQSDDEKLGFLEFFIAYMNDNVFNPEAVVAFNQLWSALSMGEDTRLQAAVILGPHYLQHWENDFAIAQFATIQSQGVNLNAMQYRDLSRAQFRMHYYQDVIAALEMHVPMQLQVNATVAREDYSNLFTAYARTGSLNRAELIGLQILARFNDIQDWKEMEQFYRSLDEPARLAEHMENARTQGYVSRDGDWVE